MENNQRTYSLDGDPTFYNNFLLLYSAAQYPSQEASYISQGGTVDPNFGNFGNGLQCYTTSHFMGLPGNPNGHGLFDTVQSQIAPESCSLENSGGRQPGAEEIPVTGFHILVATFGNAFAQEHTKHIKKDNLAFIAAHWQPRSSNQPFDQYLPSSTSELALSGSHNQSTPKRISSRGVPFYGNVVVQNPVIPGRLSLYTANVVGAGLQGPMWFRGIDDSLGVPLQTLLRETKDLSYVLLDAHKLLNLGSSTKFIVIHIQGKEVFKRQIRINKMPFTLGDFAKHAARIVGSTFDESNKDKHGVGGISRENLVLLGSANISKGRWQILLSVK